MDDTQTHSTAPWETSRCAVPTGHVQFTVYAADGTRVATVFEREANVPLIAAAPDLLFASTQALESLERIVRERSGMMGDEFHPITNLRKAIRKATAQ